MNTKKFLLSFLFIFTFTFANNGSISGIVRDAETLSPLVGVNIIIDNTSIGTATNTDGRYHINNLKPATYTLSFHMMGYSKFKKVNVIVNPDRITIINTDLIIQAVKGEQVVVTSTPFAKALDAVVSDRSIDFNEMMNDPGGVMDVVRMVQAFPAVVSGSDQGNEIITRGGEPGENLFIIDNIEIPNPNHFGSQGTGGGPISMINSLFINNVDFYAGAFPAQFGGKVSSVMNIQLKEGNREKFHTNLDMGMSGLGLFAEGPINNGNGSYMFGFKKSYLKWIANSFGLTSIPDYYSLQSKVVYDISDRNTLIWNGIYGNDKILIEDEANGATLDSYVDVGGFEYATGLTLRTLINKNSHTHLTLSNIGNYWNHDVYKTHPINPDRQIYEKDDFESEWTLKGDYVNRLNSKNTLKVGFNIKNIIADHHTFIAKDTAYTYYYFPKNQPDNSSYYFNSNDYYNNFNSETDDFGINNIARNWNEQDTIRNINSNKYSIYMQHKYSPFNNLTISAGLRYSKFIYSNYSSFSPRLGVSWNITSTSTLNFGYGKHYQEPSYYYFTQNTEANKNLKNINTQQFIIGLEHYFNESTKASIEIYHKDYNNIPVHESWVNGDSIGNYNWDRIYNLGEGYSKGVEVFIQKKPVKNLNFILSYSHYISERKDIRRDSKPYYTADYDFRDVFTLVSGYKWDLREVSWCKNVKNKKWWKYISWLPSPGDEFTISARWRYSQGKPYTQKTYDPFLRSWYTEWNTPLNTERLPAYHRLDLMFVQRHIFKKSALIVYFDIMNVYGRKNIWDYNYKDDGSIEKIYQFSLFPVGGFIWEM